ncbi:ATP-dependent RNA helicase DbpA [Collinsella sp. AK_207A]|uniref:DEAD/DEAH box helicase n=1 Tax=Collinsella sp. AK_207A TaxID=2650472 RepID=UPI001260C2FA|nr:DEAD/DEAH box helicase [Collinsella sp. AK_207A]VWL89735.1 ATP-dependent RNA helicase DbpA [Collinsella sp. AK_207A]
MDAFDRFAPFVQDFIYEHDWESLRGIQVAAADAIFNTDENVLLTASTASGKTEAAFFPILTLLDEDPPASIGALYIGPLKALINDQFLRLNDLCEEARIPVWHWHGDVSSSHKRRLLKEPGGILQITPESLEALLLHKHAAVGRLFGDLRFVVIDEVHSLLRGDRGGQTLCLIERLSRMAGVNPRRIGLSATIGDPERTGAFLSAGTGRGCIIPRFQEPRRTWRLSMEHFYTTGPQAPERVVAATGPVEAEVVATERMDGTRALPDPTRPDIPPAADAALLAPTDAAPTDADPGLGYIFERTRGAKCLVFCNSREEAEAVCSALRGYCEANHEPDRFLIHHGNISSSFREMAEELMRDPERLDTTVTTATLELGIDIGRLERAFQLNAPFTVSSFLQRMGRTGRRGEPPEMHFVMREEQPEPRSLMPETVPWELIQGIALVQLYREEKWVEPPQLDRLPYSLLYHQVMATLASCGELSPAELARRVLTLSYFHRVSVDDLRELLHHLIEIGHVETTEGGGLIVGIAGERVTNTFKFYAVFQENEEFTVRSESAELGTIVNPPPAGERIAIAGHCWLVEEVDWKRHLVYCTQVKGRVPAYFGDCPGDINTHVLERMKRALEEHEVYPYLLGNARARLAQARHVTENAGVAGPHARPLINLGGDTWVLFPWLGSYAFLALERLLKIKCKDALGIRGLDPSRPYFMQLRMREDVTEEEFFTVVADAAEQDFPAIDLVYPGEVPYFDKYDEYVPESLVRKGFAEGVLDIAGMRARVTGWRDDRVWER